MVKLSLAAETDPDKYKNEENMVKEFKGRDILERSPEPHWGNIGDTDIHVLVVELK